MDRALPFQQHPAFGRALASLGGRSEMFALRGGSGARIGSALAVWRRMPVMGDVGYLPRGPVWDPASPPEARADALARLPVRLVEAEAPCPSLRLAGYRQVATPAHVAELDLRAPEIQRRDRLHSKWRAVLRSAERSGLRVQEELFEGDPAHWLLMREGAMRRERRYRALPQALACAFARANPGAARLFVALDRDGPVAGMLMLLHAPVATYHIGWTGETGRRLGAHHLLLTVAADRLAARGFARLDLGTIDTEGAPGLARFKIGAGAQARPLGGSWLRLPFARGVALGAHSR